MCIRDSHGTAGQGKRLVRWAYGHLVRGDVPQTPPAVRVCRGACRVAGELCKLCCRPGTDKVAPARLGQQSKSGDSASQGQRMYRSVSYTHLRAHETVLDLVCRLLLEKK